MTLIELVAESADPAGWPKPRNPDTQEMDVLLDQVQFLRICAAVYSGLRPRSAVLATLQWVCEKLMLSLIDVDIVFPLLSKPAPPSQTLPLSVEQALTDTLLALFSHTDHQLGLEKPLLYLEDFFRDVLRSLRRWHTRARPDAQSALRGLVARSLQTTRPRLRELWFDDPWDALVLHSLASLALDACRWTDRKQLEASSLRLPAEILLLEAGRARSDTAPRGHQCAVHYVGARLMGYFDNRPSEGPCAGGCHGHRQILLNICICVSATALRYDSPNAQAALTALARGLAGSGLCPVAEAQRVLLRFLDGRLGIQSAPHAGLTAISLQQLAKLGLHATDAMLAYFARLLCVYRSSRWLLESRMQMVGGSMSMLAN